MGVFAIGEVVLVPFPYADFSKIKKRPALIIGRAEFDNLILCQITSKTHTSKHAISIQSKDFEKGKLPVNSYIRYDKLFTIEQSIIELKLGSLNTEKLGQIKASIRSLFN